MSASNAEQPEPVPYPEPTLSPVQDRPYGFRLDERVRHATQPLKGRGTVEKAVWLASDGWTYDSQRVTVRWADGTTTNAITLWQDEALIDGRHLRRLTLIDQIGELDGELDRELDRQQVEPSHGES